MEKLIKLLDEIEAKIPDHDRFNGAVSRANVGWHLEHVLISVVKIADLLADSDPKDYKRTLNLYRTGIMILKWFPRGRGKAPKISLPPEVISQQDLLNSLAKARAKMPVLESLDPNQFFRHPIFGLLNTPKAITFTAIHTRHHMKIVEDILKPTPQ